MCWLKKWWFLVGVIGLALGWGLAELLIMVIDKRIQEVIGG